MKHLIYLFLALIATPLVPLTGCTSRAETDALATIERARALIDTLPDSSLHLLQSIPPGALSSERSRALHALLLSQACDKNYIDISSDTLIRPALDYFTSHPDAENLPLAHYYAGRVYTNAADYSRALIHFKHAEALTDTANHILRGLIYRNCSAIYNKFFGRSEELRYMKLSYSEFEKAKLPRYSDFSAIELGTAYLNNNLYDSALCLTIPALNSLSIQNNQLQYVEALTLAATLYVAKRIPDSAVVYFEKAYSVAPNKLSTQNYRNWIDASVALNNIDKARAIKDSAQQEHQQFSTPASLLKCDNNYKAACEKAESDIAEINSIYQLCSAQPLSSTITNYYELQLAHQKLLEKNAANRTISISIIAFLLLCLTIIFFYFKKRQHQIEMECTINELSSLRNALFMANCEVTKQKEALGTLFSRSFSQLDNLCSKYYECTDDTKARRSISNAVLKEINAFQNDNNKLAELESYLNTYYNDVMIEFHKAFPKLSSVSVSVFIFTAVGFTTKSISIFLGITPTTVYQRKTRLKKILKETPHSRQNDFLSLLR